MAKRPNPKSYRPDEDDTAITRELMEFYGVKSETQLISSALRALRREMWAIREMYARPARAAGSRGSQGQEESARK